MVEGKGKETSLRKLNPTDNLSTWFNPFPKAVSLNNTIVMMTFQHTNWSGCWQGAGLLAIMKPGWARIEIIDTPRAGCDSAGKPWPTTNKHNPEFKPRTHKKKIKETKMYIAASRKLLLPQRGSPSLSLKLPSCSHLSLRSLPKICARRPE